jgi:YesN/AraC family two-component response regulator
MLKRTNDSITSIAMQTGFNNVTYFNRVFKKLEGTSPGEYRARD